MCGRYSLATPDLHGIDDRFTFRGDGLDYKPRFNVAPTQEVLTVVGNGERRGGYMRWGLIPFWAKEPKIGYKMINARDDRLLESNVYKPLLIGNEKRALPPTRCLIVADGFYEWQKSGKEKIPMRITLKGGEPFAFAGLWTSWNDTRSGETVNSCTIITTSPNDLVQQIHNRMPVILPYEAEEIWLNPEVRNAETLLSFLKPFPAGSMEAYRVSDVVNSARNETPDCIVPVG